ncbi:hypothetical protein GUA87_11720 [Sneathiella sp. P13V-1]|uniref:hypothetical protein n=1 Tax=Sneathiella sp. P13V-1 TaxID=2697366 RepID=UPI00187B582B|nr:hypothetical protein [Sneathiella sp. P13V-1]MBE7637515.1 hypothetical protein [Sneathiella sp. P13V-1]
MPRLTLIQLFRIYQNHDALPIEALIAELSRGRSPGTILIDLLNMRVDNAVDDGGDPLSDIDGLPSLFALGVSHIEAKVAQNKWRLIAAVLSGINVWLTRCASCSNNVIFNSYLQNVIRDLRDDSSDEEDDGGVPDNAFLHNLDLDYLENLRNQMQILSHGIAITDLDANLLGNLTEQLRMAILSINALRDRLTMLISVQAARIQNDFPPMTSSPALDAHIWSFIMDDELAMEHLTPTQAGPAPANQNEEEEKKEQ